MSCLVAVTLAMPAVDFAQAVPLEAYRDDAPAIVVLQQQQEDQDDLEGAETAHHGGNRGGYGGGYGGYGGGYGGGFGGGECFSSRYFDLFQSNGFLNYTK